MARVLVDKGVLHLDRYFDYAVPEELDEDAQPGVRVRVRFGAGRHRVRDGRREGGGSLTGSSSSGSPSPTMRVRWRRSRRSYRPSGS